MNLSEINKWITLFANIGVLAGIVFLLIELQQNNELMQAEARFNRLEVRTSTNDAMLSNLDLANAAAKSQAGEELTPTESFLLQRSATNLLLGWQHAFQDLSNGLIEEDDIPTENLRRLYKDVAYVSSIWESQSEILFRADFNAWMEENVVN